MPKGISPGEFQRRVRAAQQQIRREVDRVNRHNRRVVDEYNRHVDAVNRHNRQVDQQNRRVDAANRHNRQVVNDLNRHLAAASRPRTVTYTVQERQLVERVQEAVPAHDDREYDVFLSYARIDGDKVALELRDALLDLGVTLFHDDLSILAGRSIARQLDQGLARARVGVALLTPAYLAGRFWTERELGALLHKDVLIPVLHGVTLDDVRQYSGILPDLASFTTATDSVPVIATKIAGAIAPSEAA
jgi:hypothetical protein